MATAKKAVAKKAAAKKTGLKPGKAVTAVSIKHSSAEGKSVTVPVVNPPAKKVAAKKTTKAKVKTEAPVVKSETAPAQAPASTKAVITPAPAPKPVVRGTPHVAPKAVAVPAPAPVKQPSPPPAPKAPVRTAAPKQPPRPPPPPPAPVTAPAVPTPPPPPEPVVAKSPVRFMEEMTPSIRPSNVKKFPLIPLFGDSSLSQNFFSRSMPITVDMPDGSSQVVKSGFLGFNKSIELLLLSSSHEWLEAKHVTEADHIADDLKLLAICANLDGQNLNIQVKPEEHVFRPAVGDARYCTIESEFTYVSENRRVFLIKITGNINLDSGRAYLTASSNKPELEPMGFFLQGSRQSFVK